MYRLQNLMRGEPLNLVDGGQSQRSFVYIKDAIDAVLRMIVSDFLFFFSPFRNHRILRKWSTLLWRTKKPIGPHVLFSSLSRSCRDFLVFNIFFLFDRHMQLPSLILVILILAPFNYVVHSIVNQIAHFQPTNPWSFRVNPGDLKQAK